MRKRADFCLIFAVGLGVGCHNPITVETSSATDECVYFDCSTSSSSSTTEFIPTTTAEPTTTTGIDPTQFCKFSPESGFSGVSYVCAGDVGGNIHFKYFGDPELPIEGFVPFFEEEDGQPEGYVSTCVTAFSESFGPEVVKSDGRQIDACCLADSPVEAVDPFCRIDGAEEICLRMFNTIEEKRKKLLVVPALENLNLQLENLAKFLADAGTQTECAMMVGNALKSEGDFQSPLPVVVWMPQHPGELDPETGWPWFRELRLNLTRFEIEGFDETDLACDSLADQTVVAGSITGGKLTIASFFGAATPTVTGGHFSFRSVDCPLDTCEFEFDEFVANIEDFVVGPLTFSDVSATMSAPTRGLINTPSIRFGEGAMRFTALFRLAIGANPVFNDEPISVTLGNAGVARARLLNGPLFGVQQIDAYNWPFVMSLFTDLAPCDE